MGANQCKTNVISGTGLAIGARGSTAFSNTSIDNLMIFNRTTTVEECSANMNVSIPVAATDAMIAFYPGEAYNSTHVFDQDYLFANNSWFDNRTGAWSVGPDISKTGVYSVNFTAQSNTSTNISQVITINITNTAPTASIPVISCTTAYNNAACTLYAKASDPDGDSVNIQWNVTRNGTIVSSGVNSSVPSGTNLTLGGFTAAEGYVYQLNTSSTDTLLSSTKVAYTTEQFLSLPGAVLCPSILALQWNSNLSRGVYNASSKRYSEAFILPVNNTGCAWTYKLNNSNTGLSLTYTFSTNVTHANYTMLVNGTLINASSSKAIVVPNNAVYYVNWSMNLTNWYVLHAAPSANNTVSVSI
jgi:archaellum component FlaF (FlaF/FlaG flagellin family)